MSGPKGVITISSSYEHAYDCNVECVKHREAIEDSTQLALVLESLANEAPESKRHAENFKQAEDTKQIILDPNSSDEKALTINTNLDGK